MKGSSIMKKTKIRNIFIFTFVSINFIIVMGKFSVHSEIIHDEFDKKYENFASDYINIIIDVEKTLSSVRKIDEKIALADQPLEKCDVINTYSNLLLNFHNIEMARVNSLSYISYMDKIRFWIEKNRNELEKYRIFLKNNMRIIKGINILSLVWNHIWMEFTKQ